jgi:hypothetical protein
MIGSGIMETPYRHVDASEAGIASGRASLKCVAPGFSALADFLA